MRPRLIVTDLDGTLLDASGAVSALNRAALQRAHDQGVPVVVATGRPSRWLGVLEGLPGIHPEVVVSNGAGLFHLHLRRHTVVHGLDASLALEVADDLRAAIPGLGFAFEWGEHFGCEPSVRQSEGEWLVVAPLAELAQRDEPVLKLLGFHDEHGSDALAERGREVIGERLTLTHSHMGEYGLLEISAAGVTKASALADVCNRLGVEPADVVAFGDMPNDLPMLTWAGRGYAVAQGHPMLRQAGLATTDGPQPEAVGRLIEALLA